MLCNLVDVSEERTVSRSLLLTCLVYHEDGYSIVLQNLDNSNVRLQHRVSHHLQANFAVVPSH